jgi:signal transduction histidine kinase
MAIIAALKRLESRLDAWAATRLSAEEYAEAVEMDRKLKRNFWRLLAGFAGALALLAAILAMAFPALGPGGALGLSAAVCFYLLVALFSAWYGWRRYTKRPPWVVFLMFIALVLGGGIVGFVVGGFAKGAPITQLQPEKIARAVGLVLIVGIVLASLLIGVAQMRLREARQRALRLEAETQREKLERQGVQAELKLLQAQVEPHFLFNTLSNLRYLVQTRSDDALPMLDHLIHYLRTALPEMRADNSTVSREMELARAYLEIMRLRMGGALTFAIDVPPALAGASIPPLMVMTLVENAIKHGVAPMGRGHIELRAGSGAGRLRVSVEDDGRGMAGAIGQGVGLANIRERLRTLYGEGASLTLEAREPRGARAAIEVPLP